MRSISKSAIIAGVIIITTVLPGFCIDYWFDTCHCVPTEYTTIQAAINAATDGDLILVYPGTYTGEGNRDIDFLGKTLTVKSASGPEYTVLDCEFLGRGFYFHSAEDPESRLDGFAIINGSEREGAGIFCVMSSPSITNCSIEGNETAGSWSNGGGIYCYSASPIITDCSISWNTAGDDGGGIWCSESSPTIMNCWIEGNATKRDDGGGIFCYGSSLVLSNCTIKKNNASGDYGDGKGGGIYYALSSSIITGTIIAENSSADGGGGGIYSSLSSPLITNSRISGNTTRQGNGGGIYCSSSYPTITNCLITGNSSENGGGAYCRKSSAIFRNCTFAENYTVPGSGTIDCDDISPAIISNCILWNDSSLEISGNPTVIYSDVQGSWEGEGNIDEIPGFVAPDDGDFHLKSDSPCVDAGDPYSRMDLDGSINDMGTYGGFGDLPESVIGGPISGALPLSGSPYIVSEDMLIEADSTLIIEPGVELRLHNRSSIVVHGELSAAGTPDDSITVTRFREWDEGGGVRFVKGCGVLSFCRIEYCRNWNGGGISCSESAPIIQNCLISNNSADHFGGGIYCTETPVPKIVYCRIIGNRAESGGGGIYCINSGLTINKCAISENSSDYGGGVSIGHGTVLNCTITGNSAVRYGGGIRPSSSSITNCTITGNSAGQFGGGICCTGGSTAVTNCIIWDDSPDEVGLYYSSEEPVITYSDIQGGWPGEGNISTDPLFVNPDSLNFRLQEGSPCIDAGDPYSRMDLDGSDNDMGAYGGSGHMPAGVIGGSVSGSLSSSGSPYIVAENLIIEADSTLIVEPGVEFLFKNQTGIFVYGKLSAEGTVDDSIIVKKYQGGDICRGIRFIGGNGTLSFWRIEQCQNRNGGGIYCYRASPIITNCSIIDNISETYGGGICCKYASPILADCLIADNTSSFYSGGIDCDFSNPTLTNCTITGNSSDYAGGGISCRNSSSPSIENCEISHNKANYGGGGIYCYRFSSPTITNCLVKLNTASWDNGGGMYCLDNSSPRILDTSFTENKASSNGYGGGIHCVSCSSPVLENCMITGNTASDGGGISCENFSSPFLTECLITGNAADTCGGGAYCFQYASPVLVNCSIAMNRAFENDGGGIYCDSFSHPIITGCSVTGNSSGDDGGGIWCGWDSYPVITNTTLTENTAGDDGGGLCCRSKSPLIIKNSIFYDDLPGEIYYSSIEPVISYSDVQGGWHGEGNIKSDPLFVDPAAGDYRLQPDSPCIDAGDPEFHPPTGGGLRIDMGANEYYKRFNCLEWAAPD